VLQLVASALNESEAEMICGRLSDAGILSTLQRSATSIVHMGRGGTRDVYVEDGDADRARELLAAQDISDDELAELSMRAFEEITQSDAPKP
jgi:Putative prokaryotic signal transducing protein